MVTWEEQTWYGHLFVQMTLLRYFKKLKESENILVIKDMVQCAFEFFSVIGVWWHGFISRH